MPLVSLHSPFHCEEQLRLNLADNLMSQLKRRPPVGYEISTPAGWVYDKVVLSQVGNVLLHKPHHELGQVAVGEEDSVLDAKALINSVKRFIVASEEIISIFSRRQMQESVFDVVLKEASLGRNDIGDGLTFECDLVFHLVAECDSGTLVPSVYHGVKRSHHLYRLVRIEKLLHFFKD